MRTAVKFGVAFVSLMMANSSLAQTKQELTITTVAGTPGVPGSADGVGATARFTFPNGVAVGADGTVYVADKFNQTVRKITPAGVVTTLAGTPNAAGYQNGTGAAARFYYPSGIVVDTSGTVYVSENVNRTIRKITPTGVVTTLAGSPNADLSKDGGGGEARFSNPHALAMDPSGVMYVAQRGDGLIRKVTPQGMVTTLARLTGLGLLTGIAVDAEYNVYVSDDGHVIRKITREGVISTLAGLRGEWGSTDGVGAAARFYHPSGIVVDGAGTLYVSDSGNHTIRKITPAGVVTTLAGMPGMAGSVDGIGEAARFNGPKGIAIDPFGTVYVTGNHTLRKGVRSSVWSARPFGTLDTPTNGNTVAGEVAVTGWGLDDEGVAGVDIYRSPVNGEGANPVFVGSANFVRDARPDIAGAYPALPNKNRAGWGYMLLSNMLPNKGNGSFTLHAYGRDGEGQATLLGSKTVLIDNQNSKLPFGTIDTPAQGATISGIFTNFGWTLTPLPGVIQPDGQTIEVYIDGVFRGHPVYNVSRADIATLFPGLANSGGAVGHFTFDSRKLSNGTHTIAWVVRDSAGNAAGIGSRYFTVQN